MPLWKNTNEANSAPKYKVVESQANATVSVGTGPLFNNTTVDAIREGQAIGLFGANVAETSANKKIPHPGWHLVRQGTGSVDSVIVANGGTGYGNLATGSISGGTDAATLVVTTNGSGAITSVTFTERGGGFTNASTVTYPANAVATFTIGGGAGYANGETVLVSNGVVNAHGTVVTDANGKITSIALESAGRGFSTANDATVTITTANGTNGNVSVATISGGSGASFTVKLGGRAGRVHYETLVAMNSLTGASPETLP